MSMNEQFEQYLQNNPDIAELYNYYESLEDQYDSLLKVLGEIGENKEEIGNSANIEFVGKGSISTLNIP